MPRLIVTAGATRGLHRCRQFLTEKNPRAAKRAGQVIRQHLTLLETTPEIGRPLEDLPHLREFIIPFGEGGYVGLYRYEPQEDAVYLLAFRHQREAGY